MYRLSLIFTTLLSVGMLYTFYRWSPASPTTDLTNFGGNGNPLLFFIFLSLPFVLYSLVGVYYLSKEWLFLHVQSIRFVLWIAAVISVVGIVLFIYQFSLLYHQLTILDPMNEWNKGPYYNRVFINIFTAITVISSVVTLASIRVKKRKLSNLISLSNNVGEE